VGGAAVGDGWEEVRLVVGIWDLGFGIWGPAIRWVETGAQRMAFKFQGTFGVKRRSRALMDQKQVDPVGADVSLGWRCSG
jgi:hypothetical protein